MPHSPAKLHINMNLQSHLNTGLRRQYCEPANDFHASTPRVPGSVPSTPINRREKPSLENKQTSTQQLTSARGGGDDCTGDYFVPDQVLHSPRYFKYFSWLQATPSVTSFSFWSVKKEIRGRMVAHLVKHRYHH